ncbi:MAG: glycosyltransferase [Bacteroidales bacterium]|nr:glycosyltransferase [Bacteroidales bacterium]
MSTQDNKITAPERGSVKVSVVVPTYNCGKYLDESLQSLKQQTLKDIEIIVIDDGSTDDTPAVLDRWAREDYRIKIISTHNNGTSVARNIGIAHARGEYLFFLDSDDKVEPETLEHCYAKAVADNLDVVMFDARLWLEDESGFAEKDLLLKRGDNLVGKVYSGLEILKLQKAQGTYTSVVTRYVTRRSILRELNLNFCPYIIHEDEPFTLQLLICAGRVEHLGVVLYHRRMRPQSIMTTDFGKKNAWGYIEGCRLLKTWLWRSDLDKEAAFLVRRSIGDIISAIVWHVPGIRYNPEWRDVYKIVRKEFCRYLSLVPKVKFLMPRFYDRLRRILRRGVSG